MTWLLLEGLLEQSGGMTLTTLISLAMDAPPSNSIRLSMCSFNLNAGICSQIWPQTVLRDDAAGFLNMNIAGRKDSVLDLWAGCWCCCLIASGWITMRMWWKAMQRVFTATRTTCSHVIHAHACEDVSMLQVSSAHLTLTFCLTFTSGQFNYSLRFTFFFFFINAVENCSVSSWGGDQCVALQRQSAS